MWDAMPTKICKSREQLPYNDTRYRETDQEKEQTIQKAPTCEEEFRVFHLRKVIQKKTRQAYWKVGIL